MPAIDNYKEINEALDRFNIEAGETFQPFKKVIDKYPKSIKLRFSEQDGYFISIDVTDFERALKKHKK